jgi:hypothetical protein
MNQINQANPTRISLLKRKKKKRKFIFQNPNSLKEVSKQNYTNGLKKKKKWKLIYRATKDGFDAYKVIFF